MASLVSGRRARAGRRRDNARCVYCGGFCWHVGDRPPTCLQHRDLPSIDPNYAEPPDQWRRA